MAVKVVDDYPPLGDELGSGTFGTVYNVDGEPGQILKALYLRPSKVNALIQEVMIQTKLSEKLPGSCPEIKDFAKVKKYPDEYYITMEKCEGTAQSWLLNNSKTDEVVLDFLEQVATILKNANERFEFNHRDLKSDNIMYKSVAKKENGKFKMKKKYLLIDFGHSCATFDGVKYEGTSFFEPGIKCFRENRDLALLLYELVIYHNLSRDLKRFLQIVLTFDVKGKRCEMTATCPPDFNGDWKGAYEFLNMDGVTNYNTTPKGLIEAIAKYREGGLQACRGGVIDPLKGQCVPSPKAPAAPAGKPESPGEKSLASPFVVSPTSSEERFKLSPSPSPARAALAGLGATPEEAKAETPRSTGATPEWAGGKKRAYSSGCTRRRAPAARAQRKTLRHKRGIRR